MKDTNLIRLLKQMAEQSAAFPTGRTQVLHMAIQTLETQQQQISSQQSVINGLRLQLSHLQEQADNLNDQVNQWHRIADDRSAEINRLLGEISAMRKREREVK